MQKRSEVFSSVKELSPNVLTQDTRNDPDKPDIIGCAFATSPDKPDEVRNWHTTFMSS